MPSNMPLKVLKPIVAPGSAHHVPKKLGMPGAVPAALLSILFNVPTTAMIELFLICCKVTFLRLI